MKNTLCLLLILCLVGALCACGAQPNAPEASQPPEETSPAPTDTSAPAPDPAAEEGLSALLAQVRQDMHLGTAGSSLRAAALAARLLDWAETAELSDEQIRRALEPWLGPLDDGVPAEFVEQLGAVDAAVQQLTEGPGEEAAALLADAGCEDCGYPWSAKAIETLGRIMEAAGLRGGDAES